MSSALVSALAIAVATSSVNSPSRDSVPTGIGSGDVDDATITPHSRPSTRIGHPALERTPMARSCSTRAPEQTEKSGNLTG